MVMTPTPPIFVVEDIDIGIFDSLEDAQRFLEPWSIKARAGKIYDAEGRLIEAKADNTRVTLFLAEDMPLHADELTSFLRRFLQVIGEPVGSDLNCDLRALVEACRGRLIRRKKHL